MRISGKQDFKKQESEVNVMRGLDRPKKMKLIPPVTPCTTQTEWEKQIQAAFSEYRRYMQRSEARKKGDGLSSFDLTDAMAKRRQKAILNYMPEIYKRYKAPDTNQPFIGKAWIELNLPFTTHSFMDVQWHILFAASIWILDQVTSQEKWQEIYRLLPTDETMLGELYNHDVWDPRYDYDLICSVEYVLQHRNPIETDGGGYPRTVTSEWLAKRKTGASQDRQNYDALIARIPQEAIDHAVAQFREYFWQWVDRFYENLAPFLEAMTRRDGKLRESCVNYNKLVDEFNASADKLEKLGRERERDEKLAVKQRRSPLADPGRISKSAFEMQRAPFGALAGQGNSLPKSALERAAEEVLHISERVDKAAMRADELLDQVNALYDNARAYSKHITRQGRIMGDGLEDFGEITLQPMEPMQIQDPYAMCFALVYLAESHDDLPWLYGACCGLMGEVVEALPWGVYEYDELEDDVWEGNRLLEDETELPRSVTIPNFYERKYRIKGEESDFTRSLAQIIYEETGCVMPRKLDSYAGKARMLGKYGIKGKDAATVLMLMSTLGAACRTLKALNLVGDLSWLDYDPEDETEEEPEEAEEPTEGLEDTAALKDEIRKLKAALHASEKENRETKKALAGIRATEEQERRELADLREYVFNSEQAEEEEKAPNEAYKWPYEVQKNTLVFGGHDTWAKGIKGILTGNLRFIDRTYVFDTGIIKRADVIWIQPNALSHAMYDRIIDTARLYNKTVRYFSFASWARCAEQLADADRA